jgi:hypothetical protein
MKMLAGVLGVLVSLVQVPDARAAMEAIADACPGTDSICVWHRPKLAPPPGWQPAAVASNRYQANAFVPDGIAFRDAAAVMYAKAVPAQGTAANLATFMAGDLAEFRRQYPDLRVQTGLAATDGDGRTLKMVRLAPAPGGKAQWQTIAYGQEGSDYLIFTLSARDKAAHDAALPAFEAMLKGYRAAGG